MSRTGTLLTAAANALPALVKKSTSPDKVVRIAISPRMLSNSTLSPSSLK
jgi:hypothetical protein